MISPPPASAPRGLFCLTDWLLRPEAHFTQVVEEEEEAAWEEEEGGEGEGGALLLGQAAPPLARLPVCPPD
jgi:hypothetical protein